MLASRSLLKKPVAAAAALVAAVALLILVVSPVVEGGQGQPELRITGLISKEVVVRPGATRTAVVQCPAGFIPISGNVALGAITPVFDGPSANGRGWRAIGLNANRKAFDFQVGVVCARGAGSLRLRTVRASNVAAAEALRDARSAQAADSAGSTRLRTAGATNAAAESRREAGQAQAAAGSASR